MRAAAKVVERAIVGYARPAYDVVLDGDVIRSTMHRPTDEEVAEAVRKARNPEPPPPPRVFDYGRNMKGGRPRKGARRADQDDDSLDEE